MHTSRLIKLKTVLEYCAISRATVYRRKKSRPLPEPVRLTGGIAATNESSRAVAWREEEILQWIANRQKCR
ncbi:helix-turn-helix transcriptional regulator [Citrobacter portucalensis]|uniref:helix-turn-helix transcriptional regulator n=1 Tax=Citrobacter portucalensis TaxID=1639133 RepID=UPI0016479EBE|nr:AlpA family phage regulatory protein [Citrobacter portucalensis]